MTTNSDPTEKIRRTMVAAINSVEAGRVEMEAAHGKVWNTSELTNDFEVKGFMAPFVVVKEKATGKPGTLMFQNNPRFYFGFTPEDK